MNDQKIKPASDTTGSYPALVRPSQQGGSPKPAGGQSLPSSPLDGTVLEALAERLNNRVSVIQVLDRETGEVIREIPPEKARVSATGDGGFDIRLLDSRA